MKRKTISFALDTQSINKAISELKRYQRDFNKKIDLLRNKIAERLAEEAQNGFNGAIVDDVVQGVPRRAQVAVSVDKRGDITVVVADGEDAVWVEFGAGVYHNGAAGSSPHPSGAELGFTIGSFGKHGKSPAWGFYDKDGLHITHGTPAKMPMALAVDAVCNDIAEIVREVFET